MLNRRILSLWFPRLGAERVLRFQRGNLNGPFAIVKEQGNMQSLDSLSREAEAEGLFPGQPLRDAQAMCPTLVTQLADPPAEAAFLKVLCRWAGKFSPWVAAEPPTSLVVDLTGCGHLFGGEAAILEMVQDDCIQHGLSVRAGIADTLGAAWGLARFAGQSVGSLRSGDAIDQEARATRSRAAKRRHWERGGAAPKQGVSLDQASQIAPVGQTRQAIAPLPLAALRLKSEAVTNLARVGLRRVGDLAGMPRSAVARRFGQDVVRRLDQASGVEPEPITPQKPLEHFATRLTLPEPIGLEDDILAGVDRLLPVLCQKLMKHGMGVRLLRLQAFRVDQAAEVVEVGLARPSADPERMRPLLRMKLTEIDAGFGIDILRLEAVEYLPMKPKTQPGRILQGPTGIGQGKTEDAIHDLIGKIGARIGLEKITLGHPASSHIPEKAVSILAAAWADPCFDWPEDGPPRPMVLWPAEPVAAEESPDPPLAFRWRRQSLNLASARGPERIAPEWWFEDPDWRSGSRDYWEITTGTGERLWMFYAHGGALSSGWFCHGSFA